MSDVPPFTDRDKLVEHMIAGNSKLTVRSLKSGRHFTYKIKQKDDDTWYVTRNVGNDGWQYLGAIFLLQNDVYEFRTTRATPEFVKLQDAYVAFLWLFNKLMIDRRIPQDVEVTHENWCGMCGRPLTDPMSISEGYGPECRKRRLRRGMMHDRVDV